MEKENYTESSTYRGYIGGIYVHVYIYAQLLICVYILHINTCVCVLSPFVESNGRETFYKSNGH